MSLVGGGPAQDERQRLFEEALAAALDGLKKEAGERLGELDIGALNDRAGRQQAKVLAQANADEAEQAYRQAIAEAAIPWSGRFWLGLARWLIVIAFIGLLLGANVVYGYSAALSGSRGSFADVAILSADVLDRSLLAFLGQVALSLAVYVAVSRPTGLRREALVAAAAVAAAAATLLLTFSTHHLIVNLSGFGPGSEWELLVLTAAAVIDILFFTTPVRQWWLAVTDRGAVDEARKRVSQRRDEWRDELVEGLKAVLRPALDEHRFETTLNVQDAPGLRRVRDTTLHVRNAAEDLLVEVSKGMDGGSIAISGQRGVGKTELLEAFCAGPDVVADAPVGMSVMVTAPVVYDRREFILHLFTELCERARTLGHKPLRTEADRHLQWIRYLQTVSAETSWNATVRGLGLRRARGRVLARQPLTYPEIVSVFKNFLTEVAAHVTDRTGGLLIIGIDELDRIQPAASAREFFNEIKVIFDVRNCLFILSVSDDALHEAELAPLDRREVFHSAIDEVIRIEPVTQEGAVALLNPRVFGGVPEVFTALFNCLAGGIPRDLLRTARAALLFSGQERQETISETADRLVARELARITAEIPPNLSMPFADTALRDGSLVRFAEYVTERIADTPEWQAAGTTTVNSLLLLDTVLGVFSPELDEDTIKAVVGHAPGDAHSFTALARTASQIGVNDLQARASLQAIREAWALSPIPALGAPA